MDQPQFHYFSWVRTGNTRLINTEYSVTASPRAEIEVRGIVDTDRPIRARGPTVRLFGPGDVTGLDARQIIRTDPPPHTTDFEPNLFPLIEFYWPALPWLFTPTAPDSKDRLPPWLCLVVVRQDSSALGPGYPLPVLTVNDPAQELPDLNESWAWAHAQSTGPTPDEGARKLLAGTSNRTLVRLVCPRSLVEGVAYRACLVPTFEAGRKAGLGQPVSDEEKLAYAWQPTTPGPLKLPIYYHWEFHTGPSGDFEALIWELRPRPVPKDAGYQPLSVTEPTGRPAGEKTALESALRPAGVLPPKHPESTDFRKELRTLLNAHEDWEGKVALPGGMPLPPPFYARWQAGQKELPDDASTTGQLNNARWLRDLNLEVGYRAAAGLGARVVREQQEALMASAWEQLGEIDRANEALRLAQLAMEVGRRIYEQHLVPLSQKSPEGLLALTGPVQARVYGESAAKTVRGEMDASCLPVAAVQGTFRRLTRPRGPLGRRLGTSDDTTGGLLRELNKPVSTLRFGSGRTGMVTLKELDRNSICELTPEQIRVRVGDGPIAGEDPEYQDRRNAFYAAVLKVQKALAAYCIEQAPACKPLDVSAVSTTLLTQLRPEKTVPARIGDRLTLPRGRKLDPSLDPILAHPVFPQAMYRSLAELSERFMLAGVENIPQDTILLLESNPAFIEAFMAGLNDEMGRELLWRGYPTDQRGTYFRRFWDPRSNLNTPEAETYDITSMDEWKPADDLGVHRPGEAKRPLAVLLIRGRLLQRFPNALIYAARAQWTANTDAAVRRPVRPVADPGASGYLPPSDPDYPERYPIFQGTLPPDLTFLGFDLSADEMRGAQDAGENKPGWFIVLQQQPTQPRYGLDETRSDEPNGTWEDLSWEDVELTACHIAVGKALKPEFVPPSRVAPDKDIKWDDTLTSARLAYMTLQTPVRVAIRASELLRNL
jgi:hypothetical protein